jgi:hypothetical protein
MHTSEINPAPLEGKEPDSTQGGAVVESTAQPNEARPLISAATPIAAEALDPKDRRTPRLLDAMFHWALSR